MDKGTQITDMRLNEIDLDKMALCKAAALFEGSRGIYVCNWDGRCERRVDINRTSYCGKANGEYQRLLDKNKIE